MHQALKGRTTAQRIRRARKLARRREAGHEPRPPAPERPKGELENARVARIRARRLERARKAWKQDNVGPETAATWARYLGWVTGGAARAKHRIRKVAKATRQAARR